MALPGADSEFKMRKLISVAVPAYNESANIDELARRLAAVFDSLSDRYDFEAVICENGSQDDTFEKLVAVHRRDPRFKIVQLLYNTGSEGGLSAALANCSGDAAVIMNADLQDPPELLPRFLERWEEGYDNVYGVITKRHDESALRKFLTRIYYVLLNKASGGTVPQQVSDFRLVDRAVYEGFNQLPHRFRFIRIAWTWLSVRPVGIEHERPPRPAGRSTFRYIPAIWTGVRTILSVSHGHLRWIGPFGTVLAMLSFLVLAINAVRWIVLGVPFAGFGTLVGIDLLLFGFLFLLLGMISEYLQLILVEVRAMPHFMVRKKVGLEPLPRVFEKELTTN